VSCPDLHASQETASITHTARTQALHGWCSPPPLWAPLATGTQLAMSVYRRSQGLAARPTYTALHGNRGTRCTCQDWSGMAHGQDRDPADKKNTMAQHPTQTCCTATSRTVLVWSCLNAPLPLGNFCMQQAAARSQQQGAAPPQYTLPACQRCRMAQCVPHAIITRPRLAVTREGSRAAAGPAAPTNGTAHTSCHSELERIHSNKAASPPDPSACVL
jgi:hypothetical protein